MTDMKWEIGPVTLVNGCDATIHRFCEKRQRYIGEWSTKTGGFYAAEWHVGGSHTISGVGDPLLDLAPPPKKTVRVQRYVNVFEDGCMVSWPTREDADGCKEGSRFACIEIDRIVTEGEGL